MTGGSDSLFQIAWRGKWFILLSTILGVAGAYVYLQRVTPMYTSRSGILVEKHGGQPSLGAPQPLGSTSTNFLQTQANMITSPEILAAAMRDLDLLTLSSLQDPGYAQDVLRTLSARVGKNTDIIDISASSAHPEDATQVVNAVVRAYIAWHRANRQLSTADLLKDLSTQLDKRSEELKQKYRERKLYEQRYPEVLESARGGPDSQTHDLLRQELATAHSNVIRLDSYCSGLQKGEQEPGKFRQYVRAYGQQASVASGAEDGERARLIQELENVRLQLEAISAGGEITKLSQITLLQKRKAQIEERIAEVDKEFVQNHMALAKSLAEDARAREQQLTEMYAKESAKTQNTGEHHSEYVFITSECTMMENMYNSLLNQINALDLNARFEGLTIHVLAKAFPATAPSSPQAARIMGIGLALGLMIGVGLAFLRDWRDQSVRSADEITAILGVPVLGAVPSISRRRFIGHGRQSLHAPGARESEAFRGIRTALLLGTSRELAATILVTSPGALEGKTTLVSNLGIVMAQAGQKTLIVDADLRKPMQHQGFAKNGHDQGLTDVLGGRVTREEAIRSTKVDGLDVLASGRHVTNPSELLNSKSFATLLEQLKGSYDRILVDSPPVGLVTDAQILAAHIDLTLVVLRAGRTTRLVTQQTRDALLSVGARLAGAVVNDVSKRNTRYSRYGVYGYYERYHGSNGHRKTAEEGPTEVETLDPHGAGTAEARKSDDQVAGKERSDEADAPVRNSIATSEEETGRDTPGKGWRRRGDGSCETKPGNTPLGNV
jgi:capsular exopolysaccharide synthesis family protein